MRTFRGSAKRGGEGRELARSRLCRPRGGVGGGPQGKGSTVGPESGGPAGGGRRPRRASNPRKPGRGRPGPGRAGADAAVPAEIVQDAAGNLHPFRLHDEDPQQEQCIPAPRSRGRGCGSEAPARRRAGSAAAAAAFTGTRGGRGETRSLPSGAFSPRPPEAGPRRGRSPGSHAPVLLERPNGKLEDREPERVSQ